MIHRLAEHPGFRPRPSLVPPSRPLNQDAVNAAFWSRQEKAKEERW